VVLDKSINMELYDHQKIEKKWQKAWEKDGLYKTPDLPGRQAGKPKKKKYILDMFPYISGAGLHVGHPEGYTATDIYSRFLRMQGYDVLHPIGWDAFGLPTENFAIKSGIPPQESVKKYADRFEEQIRSFGFSYDWDRLINTSDPKYYRWTQWLFLQLYKHGLAYKKEAYVNWCPKDQTVLANEQVVDGCCERCGTKVEQKLLNQWFFKITDYADRLLADLDGLDWPEPIKAMQRNWIGKSEGAEIEFEISDSKVKRFVILHGKHGTSKLNFIPWLKSSLEKQGYEVQAPDMPGTEEPNDLEQADFVQKNCKLDKNTVILGHSFGGIVALRLLERGIGVHGVVFAATPMSSTFLDGKVRRTVAEAINRGFDFEKIKRQTDYVKILVDSTDTVVRLQDGDILADKLNSLKQLFAGTVPHFCGKEEPALLEALTSKIKVFTTRVDTLFGATYLVLAPEHPLVDQITTADQKNYVINYVIKSKEKTELQRTALEKEKTGVFTGGFAINPATKEKIPVWIADYVLMGYGTGAIMAVPAHDERDFEFAKKYKLPIRQVIEPPKVINALTDISPAPDGIFGVLPTDLESDCWIGDGTLINSGDYDGHKSEKVRMQMTKEFGQLKIQYKLRDWLVSRQRYWGAPIPIIYCDDCGKQAVPEKDLPVLLPTDVDFLPTGESPIARSKSFHQVKCPNCGQAARRDSDTMDTFVDSAWYFYRFTDPHNDKQWADKKQIKQWLPVDVYVGGAEHAVLHLLYARFITKAFRDFKLIDFEEPFSKLRNQGLILGPDGEKMSKSRGNVINPDEVIAEWGADAFRLYEMFMGPLEDSKPWNTTGIVGLSRFLEKVWRHGTRHPELDSGSSIKIHKLIKKIGSDIEFFKFNTGIAAFMQFLNENKSLSKQDLEVFLVLLAPFAPHITEELWHNFGHKDSIHQQPWPKFDEKLIEDKNVTIVVQILGRVRASFELPAGTSQQAVKDKAISNANVKKYLDGKQIIKEIFVPDKLINFVVK